MKKIPSIKPILNVSNRDILFLNTIVYFLMSFVFIACLLMFL